MINIEIKEQKQLTLKETFDFCISSIRHRFTRSLLTLSVVVLAVAFFMYLQCGTLFRNSVKQGVEQEILDSRMPSKLLGMVYTPFTINEFTKLLLDARKNAADKARMARVLGLTDRETEDLLDSVLAETKYTMFFSNLAIGRRKELFERREGGAIYEFLTEPGELDRMFLRIRQFGGFGIPGGEKPFRAFIGSYKTYEKVKNEAYRKWQAFQDSMKDAEIGQNDPVLIRQYLLKIAQDPQQLQAWLDKLDRAGFKLTPEEWNCVRRYQEMSEWIARISKVLLVPACRRKWQRTFGQGKYVRMDEKLALLDTSEVMEIIRGETFEDGIRPTDKDLHEIAEEFRSRRNLRELEIYLDIKMFEMHEGFTPSQKFLLALSFLVCVVGITNAMLMSITERFREIATLKCLGATDSFILIQIVLEALIQGIIGSFVGIILGFFAALVNTCFQVGLRVFSTFDVSAILLAGLYSLLAGMLMAVFSAMYPSLRAARMAPMEAMRVE